MKNIERTIRRVLARRLERVESRITLTAADTAEVLRIKAALDADRPTADLILGVLFNQMSFLNRTYAIETDDEYRAILAFLQAFQAHVQQEFLATSGTQKDGLLLAPPGGE